MVFTLARLGLHGAVHLPEGAPEAAALKAELVTRLVANAARAQRLARSRTSDERRVEDLARLLEHWLVHGRPDRRARRADAAPAEPAP